MQETNQQHSADRLNKMLFVLTVATFIFAPMQFMTGVYGMNFTNREGLPTIPELLEPNGYKTFWMGTLIYLVVMLSLATVYFCRIQRARMREDAERQKHGHMTTFSHHYEVV